MKTIKRYFTCLIATIFLICQIGCAVTSTLLSRKTTDYIDAFLINPKTNQLLVIGKKYHYLFDITSEHQTLINVLNWKNKNKLSTSFFTFKVDNDDSSLISGKYEFKFHFDKSIMNQFDQENAEYLEKIGFSKYSIKDYAYLDYWKEIKGVRYLAQELNLKEEQKLSHSYPITFDDDTSEYSPLFLPLAIVADIVLFIPFSLALTGSLLIRFSNRDG